jgi:hypothetical protein
MLLKDSTLCYTNKHVTAHIKNKLKTTDTRAIFQSRYAIMHTIATTRWRGCHAAHSLTSSSPSPSPPPTNHCMVTSTEQNWYNYFLLLTDGRK